MNKLLAGVAGLAAIGFAGSAMAAGAIDAQNFGVNVQIDVMPVVSMWATDENITLTMDGADGNNSATAASQLVLVNNVDARVDASVSGTLPTPIVAGGGINFFIFNGGTPGDAVNAITANAYNPAGALAWNIGNLGQTQTLIASTGVNTSMSNRDIVYASASPGEAPLPNTYNLAVTYTISPN